MRDLRLGRWQDELQGVTADVLFTDTPYSPKTHQGFRGVGDLRQGTHRDGARVGATFIDYSAIDEAGCFELAEAWSPRIRRWAIIFGDHDSWRWHRDAWRDVGWYTFHPIPVIKKGAPPRFAGDGPASEVEWLMVAGTPCPVPPEPTVMMVARPRQRVREHLSRPGYYEMTSQGRSGSHRVIGVKDVAMLMQVLGDYTRPGDLIADPYAGTATVGEACIRTGRLYVGAEVDEKTHAVGAQRLANATPCMPGFEPDRWRDAGATQEVLAL